MNRRSILLFLSLALTGCSGSQVRKPEVKTRNCAKTVTVYMDKLAEENFKSAETEVRYVLELANLNFASQGISVKYDLNSLKVKKWSYRFDDLPNRKNYEEIKASLTEFRNNRFGVEEDSSDVHIFITGRIVAGEGNVAMLGWKFFKFGNKGRGPMLIGNARIAPTYYDYYKDMYLITLASTIAHEQCHLFGLPHAGDHNSLMHPIMFYGRTKLLDVSSKNRLQDILSIEKKCPAP